MSSPLTDEQKAKIVALKNKGHGSRKIGFIVGCSKTTVNNYLLKCVYDSGIYLNVLKDDQTITVDDVFQSFKAEDGEIKQRERKSLFTDYQVDILTNKAMSEIKPKKTILVIADTQCKSEESLDYMKWIGKYIVDKKPDVIVHIGDHYDFPSLSSYDKGTGKIEGKRLVKDVDAGNLGFEYLNQYIHKEVGYNPRKVFCCGNHEDRLDRYVNEHPELQGFIGTDKLPFEKYGWEVHTFLKPVEIEGIFFVHYLANPFNGKPYGGNAMNILKTVGRSFVVGHKQCLDIAIRPTIDGKQQIGIINGACYDFDEGYKGYQGNNHFRGLTVLHEVEEGFGVPMFVSLDYMKEKFYG